VAAVFERTSGVSQPAIEQVLIALVDVVVAGLSRPGDMIELPGIGRLKLTQRPDLPLFDLATGEVMGVVPGKKKVKFMPAQSLIKSV
jgi:nucleoid DNA-binding protein